VVDPNTEALFPLSYVLTDDGAVLTAGAGLQVNIMDYTLALQTFRLAMRFQSDGSTTGTAEISGSAICADLGVYGGFLEQLGLCNPQTNSILVLGASNDALRTDLAPIPAVGSVTFSGSASALTATVTGSQIDPTQHLAALLAVDPSTGLPITLEYGTSTTRTTASDGTLASVSVPTMGTTLPATVQVFLMVDTTAAASGVVTP
jgi:hypothetical protein